jgi:alpha-1,6-mannosyltransferase
VGPVLSDDVQRYVWEGAVTASGASPYAAAPDDPSLAHLRAELPELHARVAHREVAAAYPPLAQLVHAAAWSVAPGRGDARARTARTSIRGVYAACDLAVVVLLALLLRQRGLAEARCVAWAWSPTCAVEFAGSGHLDSLAIALVLGAWCLVREPVTRARELAGCLLLGAAVAVRYLPLAVVPGWLSERRERVLQLVALCALWALVWTPFAARGGLLGGLAEYGERWEGFNLGFRAVASVVRALQDPEADPRELAHAARVASGTLWLAIAGVAFWRVREGIGSARIAIGSFLLFAPVVHPWYATWMAPFVALRRDVEWVWLLAAIPLAYAPLEGWRTDGRWSEPEWCWPLVALPFFLLAALRATRGHAARSA